jgi:hypothetical protein
MAKITLISGSSAGKSYAFTQSVLIGREQGCNLILENQNVSGRHVQISRSGSCYVIVDLGSTNGTKLNGTRIAANRPMPINSGDQFTIDAFTFQFEAGEARQPVGPVDSSALDKINYEQIAKWFGFTSTVLFISGIIACVTIVGAIFGWVYIVIGNYGRRSASNLKLYLQTGQGNLYSSSLQDMKNYFTWMGVMTIIGLCFAGIYLIVLLIIFAVGASRGF